ncbi:hypothetical protein RND81_06G017300 [Saponaria officinalis]|uniref:Protein kinase domain-containing protein n=1 Tax=Saponaria officinalis TaxID=3572 RepID=A0AAW1K3R0_SAPOF
MKNKSIISASSMVVDDYILTEKINESSYSTVWRGFHKNKPNKDDVAIKQINLSKLSPTLKSSLDCELNFLSTVTHPNIIRLFSVFQVGGSLFLVFEFCSEGSLASYIQRHGKVEEQIAREFMHQLGAGLRILQHHHIIHRDLKPENILLSGSENSTELKIADFGLSRHLYSGNYAETVCGSPLYMAPEVLEFKRYDEKVDMWSIGAILFELLDGHPPFPGRSNVQLLKKIRNSRYPPFSQLVRQTIHPDCFDLCSRLLCVNPVNRLSLEEFYTHRFFMQTEEGP